MTDPRPLHGDPAASTPLRSWLLAVAMAVGSVIAAVLLAAWLLTDGFDSAAAVSIEKGETWEAVVRRYGEPRSMKEVQSTSPRIVGASWFLTPRAVATWCDVTFTDGRVSNVNVYQR